MAEKAPQSYADGLEKARRLVAQGRLNDPDEHFPYKHEQVRALVEENPPAGPEGPDDDSLRIEDHMSVEIADATRDYVEAQAALLEDDSERNKELYDAAAEALVDARKAHRANRTGFTVNAVRARRAGE